MLPLVHIPETTRLLLILIALGAPALLLLPLDKHRALVVRLLAVLAFLTPVLGIVLWRDRSTTGWGVRITWSSLMVLAPVVVSLWPCLLLARLALVGSRRTASAPSRTSPAPSRVSRRTLLQGSAAALPLGAASLGVAGLSDTSEPQQIPIIPMRYPDLHPDLVGLKILQLSDLHLGIALDSTNLERLLERVQALAPDLIVLTGDVADHMDELEKALEVVHRFRPRLGVFACLGNHEYLHDIEISRPIYERSPVPLLVGEGVSVQVGAARLFIGGADDPIHKGDGPAFLDKTIGQCAASAGPSDFKLLLCHRPEGFIAASKHGFDLTLSGHTHGGQVGVFGKSVFERLLPEQFAWGPYRRGKSRLYTTSGFGYWFPFRLGCPTEAPLIVLTR